MEWGGVGSEVGNVFDVYERIKFALTEFHLNLMSPKMRDREGAEAGGGRQREAASGRETERGAHCDRVVALSRRILIEICRRDISYTFNNPSGRFPDHAPTPPPPPPPPNCIHLTALLLLSSNLCRSRRLSRLVFN